jgi:hypothetical protein
MVVLCLISNKIKQLGDKFKVKREKNKEFYQDAKELLKELKKYNHSPNVVRLIENMERDYEWRLTEDSLKSSKKKQI